MTERNERKEKRKRGGERERERERGKRKRMREHCLYIPKHSWSNITNDPQLQKGAKFSFFFFSAIITRSIHSSAMTALLYYTFLQSSFSSLHKVLPLSHSTLNYARASFLHRSPSCPTLKSATKFLLFFFKLIFKLRCYGEQKNIIRGTNFDLNRSASFSPRGHDSSQGRVSAWMHP